MSVADGGDNSLGNLQAICVRCNDSKGEHSDWSDGDVSQLLLDIQDHRIRISVMTTQAVARQRRARGRYTKTQDGAAPKREKRIPEYLEADEMNAIIRAAPSPKAKLLMLEQWRAGLRVSEALDLEVRDLSLDTATPTLRVRSGKGGKTRLVPVHPELHGALSSALAYGDISQGRIIEAHTTTAWRWVKAAVKHATVCLLPVTI